MAELKGKVAVVTGAASPRSVASWPSREHRLAAGAPASGHSAAASRWTAVILDPPPCSFLWRQQWAHAPAL